MTTSLQVIGHISSIEPILYGEGDIYHWTPEQREEFQFEIIRGAFELHFNNCEIFRRFCCLQGVTPDEVQSPFDFHRIPLIPSSMFKSVEIRTGPEERIVKVCCSSGTRGRVSRVPRDDTSLERFIGSIRISADQLLQLRAEAKVFNLGPGPHETANIWFPYVMSLLNLVRPTENFVSESVFYPKRLLQSLTRLPKTTQPILVGPPIFFLYFMEFLSRQKISIDLGARRGIVITAGGWKSFTKEQVERDLFVSQCAERLGIQDPANIRDAYNMVELNTVMFECEVGNKHIPPWLAVSSLEPETLTPTRDYEMGLLAFIDPLPTSYPGFILTDDFGRINRATCECGRSGPTMEFCRRVELAEGRGCALTMDRNIKVSNSVGISEDPHESHSHEDLIF